MALYCIAYFVPVVARAASQMPEAGKQVPAQILHVDMIGDSLAEGLWEGLIHKYASDRNLRFVDHSKVSTGISREDFFDWPKNVDRLVQAGPMKVVFVMIGGNDDQPIRVDGQKYREPVGTELWKKTYGDRAEAMMRSLLKAGAVICWVGVPAQRNKQDDISGRMINDIVRERADKAGIAYVDIYAAFAGPDGSYSAYLPDKSGRQRLMRSADGLHFTSEGWNAVADYVIEHFTKDPAAAALLGGKQAAADK